MVQTNTMVGGIMPHLICLCLITISCVATPNYNISTDQLALLAFKSYIASDPGGVLTNSWMPGKPVCRWRGITCSTRHSRVTSLKLLSMGLTGTIAREIGSLSFLAILDIGNNSFQGGIPVEIGHLRRLNYLSLQYNHLTGLIPPSFGLLDRLQVLDLSNNYLTGTVPFSLFNIASLRIIDLNYNRLHGGLPPDICHGLPRLEGLSAVQNQLGGQLPSFENCRQLIYIALSINQFTGGFPKEIANLSLLQEIYLGVNNLTGSLPQEIGKKSTMLQKINIRRNNFIGVLPPSLGNLSNLKMMDLGHNYFQGSIPSEFGHLSSSLQELYLNFNNFSGDIQKAIFNISALQMLAAPGNSFTGVLPADMVDRLPNIQQVYFGLNKFTGQIPESIFNASKLSILSFGNNFLSGHIPAMFGNLAHLDTLILENNQLTSDPTKLELEFLPTLVRSPSLRTLQIGYNQLNGVLPKFLSGGNISSLEKLHASGCGLKGMISTDIGNFSNLYWLSLAENDLVGQIPETIGNLIALQRLRMYSNRIEGRMPSGLCNLKVLYELSLSNNKLFGEFPSCLGNISTLRELYLDSNALISELPSTFWSNKGMLVVDLSSNFLNGTLGQQIGGITGLRLLYLDNNTFSGPIPNTIGHLQDLLNLSISMNLLEGPIPQEFGDMSSLEYLDLSHNHIYGTIPKSMEKLHLVYLNLSFNKLEGEIPNGGPFRNISSESFIGNHALCGASRFHVVACENKGTRKARKGKVLVYILSFCAVAIVVIAIVIWICFRRRRKSLQVETTHDLTKRYSYIQILKGTNSFDEANLLGRGSYGVVYKAIFPNEINIVAVKIFNVEVREALKSFASECEALRNIRHRNLVKVITACSNLDFKAIIFEYMPNGSLDDWLHYYEDKSLDMIQRLCTAIDIASALEYLHHSHSISMVHCDLKPKNILFDRDMVARLGDFGISKMIRGEKPFIQTGTLGTMGYMAPEYGSEGIISTMADVFSYGVLLMEIFIGKRPTDEMFNGDFTIKQWVLESLHGEIMDIVDPRLHAMIGEEEIATKSVCFRSIMELALACTDDTPENRVNMQNVLAKLKKIKSQFY